MADGINLRFFAHEKRPDVAADLSTVQPAQVEAARAEVRRLYQELQRHGLRKVDALAISCHKERMDARTQELRQWEAITRQLADKQVDCRAKIKQLKKAIFYLELWSSMATGGGLFGGGVAVTLIVTTLFFLGSALLAGFLVGLILFCLTTLAVALWFLSKDAWSERLIADNNEKLQEAESQLRDAHERSIYYGQSLRSAEQDLQKARSVYQESVALRDLWDAHAKAYARLQNLTKLVQSRKYQLYHADWRDMRGVAFEDFLRQVFETLGYQAEVTKASGDQGVDLVVVGHGRRIGIQAKGYAGSVGNHAVMEAHAGMVYYNCHSCMVITNSEFTRQAKDLAAKLNCTLIGGEEIPRLIDGSLLF